MLIELLVKPNGAKVDPPRRFPDCASECEPMVRQCGFRSDPAANEMYPQHPNAHFGRRWGFSSSTNWLEGGTSWTQDYPRVDRHFAQAVRCLTRVNARSAELPVILDDGDLFQFRRRRFLGVGGRPAVPGEVLSARDSDWR